MHLGHLNRVTTTDELDITVVVPTWNEEAWLPDLLRRIRSLTGIKEIIVADFSSADRTAEIARVNGCVVVHGGGPAVGRNNGAARAASDLVVFADADAFFSEAHLAAARAVFEDPTVVGVHFALRPVTASAFVRFCYWAMEIYFVSLAKVGVAQATGTFLVIRRDAYVSSGGFREDLSAGEDADFVRRLGRHGQVVYLRVPRVGTSSRRFSVEQPLVFAAKTVMWALLRLAGSSFSVRPYRWMPYPSSLAALDVAAADRFLDVNSVRRSGVK